MTHHGEHELVGSVLWSDEFAVVRVIVVRDVTVTSVTDDEVEDNRFMSFESFMTFQLNSEKYI